MDKLLFVLVYRQELLGILVVELSLFWGDQILGLNFFYLQNFDQLVEEILGLVVVEEGEKKVW